LSARLLGRIVKSALPGHRVLSHEPLLDGLRNANFKLHLDSEPAAVVLRIYEHDPSLCRKEIDLMRLVAGSVPVPEIIYAEPLGRKDLPPFRLTRWVEGVTFLELKRAGDPAAIAQAADAAGAALAAIGQVRFPEPGWLLPGPAVGQPLLEGADVIPRFVDLCLASPHLRRRMPAELRDRTHALIWSAAPLYTRLAAETRLVHGDFSKRNLLMRRDAERWIVAAVLDWEFAVSGSPLADLATFLRYERPERPLVEPYFSTGYQRAAGALPPDWPRLARLLDLAAICEGLTHSGLPPAAGPELVDLVRATIENRGF
jgi:aminoglycoside phosphotransferase (APT) family kinase protein